MSKGTLFVAAALAAVGVTALAVPSANAASTIYATAHFSTPKTDGLSKVTGSLQVRQSNTDGVVTVLGRVKGLQPTAVYVAVPYTDKNCTPLPGLTAFPSGLFITNSDGSASVYTKVNPKSINPLGKFDARQTKSVSIRRVVVQGLSIPGAPVAVPTVPNVVAVEACDKAPTHP